MVGEYWLVTHTHTHTKKKGKKKEGKDYIDTFLAHTNTQQMCTSGPGDELGLFGFACLAVLSRPHQNTDVRLGFFVAGGEWWFRAGVCGFG